MAQENNELQVVCADRGNAVSALEASGGAFFDEQPNWWC
jgi:hypothetical protein